MASEGRSPRLNKTPSFGESLKSEKCKKYAFMSLILVLAVLTIRDVADLIINYLDDPKNSNIEMVFNDSMAMPNFTFCMSKAQAWSHFKINDTESDEEWNQIVDDRLAELADHDSFLKEQWDWRMVMEVYDLVATYNTMERETSAHGSAHSIHQWRTAPRLAQKRETAEKWKKVSEDRNVTFTELAQKAGTEALRRSLQRFQRVTYDDDDVIKTSLRVSWISMQELCFQPIWDKSNFKEISDQGRFFTLMLSHNAENVETLDCMSVDMHGRPSSLNRFMEGKGRAKDGYTFELCVGQRHEVTVEVRALYQMLENDENGTRCRDVEKDMDNEFNCRSKCRMNMIREMCKCTGVTLSYLATEEELKEYPICDYAKCVLDVQKGNFSDTDCANNCFRDCKQIRFNLDHETQGRMARPDLTMINLNWGSFEYLNMKQEWEWTVATFIAALGGSIGMWLGLSILSLIQGSTYLYSLCCKKVKKVKKVKSQVYQMDDNNRRESKVSVGANPFSNPFVATDPSGGGQAPPPRYNGESRIQVE